jgi:hypothetical protein
MRASKAELRDIRARIVTVCDYLPPAFQKQKQDLYDIARTIDIILSTPSPRKKWKDQKRAIQ